MDVLIWIIAQLLEALGRLPNDFEIVVS
jgi:hypothetical protein